MVKQAVFTRDDLRKAIDRLPRIRLAHTPTPLEELPRLSKALGGPQIWVKRDDLTGLSFGGNKARHMEFNIANAVKYGSTHFVYSFVWTSNYARMISAACTKVGIKPVFVVKGVKEKPPLHGNMLLEYIQDTEFHYLESEDSDTINAYCNTLCEELKKKGDVPYLFSAHPESRYAGTIAYLDCALELAEQMEAQGIGPAYLYLVGGNSMGGLALAAKLLNLPWKLVGIYAGDRPKIYESIYGVADGVRDYLELPFSLDSEDFEVYEEYLGEGYGLATEGGVEAIKIAARTDGLILDPIYTGKAMAGLIDHIRTGKLGPKDTVVFVHTGGLPALFLGKFEEALTSWGV